MLNVENTKKALKPEVSDVKPVENKTERELIPVKTKEEVIESVKTCSLLSDPDSVFRELRKNYDIKEGKQEVGPSANAFKALTTFEFEKGPLLSIAVDEQYRTFGIDLMRKVQGEFNCTTPSEKATAELMVISYIRTLEIQRRINGYLSNGTITHDGVGFLNVMSKELDRANRHYLTALQTLRMLKQPPMQVNIKTQTAVVGQNQIVQSNNGEKINDAK